MVLEHVDKLVEGHVPVAALARALHDVGGVSLCGVHSHFGALDGVCECAEGIGAFHGVHARGTLVVIRLRIASAISMPICLWQSSTTRMQARMPVSYPRVNAAR